MMKHNIIAASLLAAVTMMTVGCNKEDNIVPIEPKAKVSRIYTTNTTIMERYNDSTQTWDTTIYLPSERKLNCELIWTGNRLDSMHHGVNIYLFTYDSRGRLVHVEDAYTYTHFDLDYNASGQLSRVYKCSLHEGDTVYKETYLYFWSDGKLERLEDDIWALEPNESGLKHKTLLYTWAGDNISKTVSLSLNFNGNRDTVSNNYEVNNLVNPFYGFPFWQIPYREMIGTHEAIDGLNKNLLTRCYNDNSEHRYEYTTTGGRVTGVHEVYTTSGITGLIRSSMVTDYEIEYVN